MQKHPSNPIPSPDWHQALGQANTDKRLDILRLIGACGSISQAAREAGVSYKAAWQAIDTLSNLAGTPLVERAVGGSGGGGALLTTAGQALLEGAEWMALARQEVLAKLAIRSGQAATAVSPNLLGLRTSMRNQLPCQVLGISRHQGAVKVRLQTTGGALLQARVTRDSAQLLGLAVGKSVLALCKAMAVDVSAVNARTSRSLNALHGQVLRISRAGQAMAEVTLALAGGGSWVGMAGMVSNEAQPLRVGDSAVACFDASAVVLGVDA